ncbi:hypothetical protein MPTA5024_01655 [Microbispora sp. ATCC PTA-5024]|nr:hypothetical protein MPTA5024_01655 [Microbispora sp. ATCC PTA-5024]
MRAFRDRVGGLAYGGDYNPEQWGPPVWREDVRLMREAGVNLVSLGVFAWATLEPQPGTYEFGRLDEVMDLLHDNGVAVNLATPTAAPSAWLTHRHPEVLRSWPTGGGSASATACTTTPRPRSTVRTRRTSPPVWPSGTRRPPGTRQA